MPGEDKGRGEFDPARVVRFPSELCRKPVYRWQIDRTFSPSDEGEAWDIVA